MIIEVVGDGERRSRGGGDVVSLTNKPEHESSIIGTAITYDSTAQQTRQDEPYVHLRVGCIHLHS